MNASTLSLRSVSAKLGLVQSVPLFGANEIEILGRVFPDFRWWLLTGEVQPGIGQKSPDYDEANRNLANPNAG
jgi:hypothetical protein